MKKAISFKTAFVVVIGLHVLGYIGMVQLSSLRYKISKANWNEKLKISLSPKHLTSYSWPTANPNLKKTVTTPPIKTVKIEPVTQNKLPNAKPKTVDSDSNTTRVVYVGSCKQHSPPIIKTNKPTANVSRSTIQNNNRVIYKKQTDFTENIKTTIEEITRVVYSGPVL